jgi:Amt family ammonium transporter
MQSLRSFRQRSLVWTSRMLLLSIALTSLAMVFVAGRAYAQAAPKPDPAGTVTGNAGDAMDAGGTTIISTPEYKANSTKEPLAARSLDAIGQNRIAINIMWTLVTGYLVMFMQAGFAMVECGFTQAKNAAHVFMTNFMIYPIGMLGYWICGFAFMFGGTAAGTLGGTAALAAGTNAHLMPFIGTDGFFLRGPAYDVGAFTLFLFEMVFMDTTATIPTGAMAERWKFSSFIIYGFFVSTIIYPIYGHWVWGGGWLAQLATNGHFGHGAVDFAGSGVVHAIGGWTALAGAIVLGPRIGKYKDGKPQVIPAHNIPMALIGCFILAFGWFGFNPGSTLGASGAGNLRIGVIATNTMLASAAGAFASLMIIHFQTKKFDPGMACNGMLAGLVAITCPCAFVDSFGAVALGAIAGIIVVFSCQIVEKMGVDDPVGAVSVHGVCGIWGLISLGIFGDGTFGQSWNGGSTAGVAGILYDHSSNGTGQLLAQLVDSAVNIAWSFGVAFVFFKIQNALTPGGIRAKREDEIGGMDIPEMGVLAYPGLYGDQPATESVAASI